MTELVCDDCGFGQDVRIDSDTYVVTCVNCRSDIDVPRKYRGERKSSLAEKSSVNIRLGYRPHGDTLSVAWTVQSAEKKNKYLEQRVVDVDVSSHPEKLYWYVAVFKTLQRIDEYKSARMWIKDNNVMDHLSGKVNVSDDDLRYSLKQSIISLANDKFFNCEFCSTNSVGYDIDQMLC